MLILLNKNNIILFLSIILLLMILFTIAIIFLITMICVISVIVKSKRKGIQRTDK